MQYLPHSGEVGVPLCVLLQIATNDVQTYPAPSRPFSKGFRYLRYVALYVTGLNSLMAWPGHHTKISLVDAYFMWKAKDWPARWQLEVMTLTAEA